jgi:hypothetical protein
MPEEQLRALIANLKHDMGPMKKPKGPANHLDEAVAIAKGAGFDDRKVKQLTHETSQPFERIDKELELQPKNQPIPKTTISALAKYRAKAVADNKCHSDSIKRTFATRLPRSFERSRGGEPIKTIDTPRRFLEPGESFRQEPCSLKAISTH